MKSWKYKQKAIIGEECEEHFLNYPVRGILMGGLSSLVYPYEISRPEPRYHVLLFCLGGSAEYLTPETRGEFSEGTAYLFPAGIPHRYSIDRKRHRRLSLFWLHMEEDSTTDSRELRVFRDPRFEDLVYCAKMLLKEHSPPFEDQASISSSLVDILQTLLGRILSGSSTRRDKRVERLIRRMKGSLHSPWGIRRMADVLGCSPGHVYRLLRNAFQRSPHEVLADLRMTRAKHWLASTEYTLDHIAVLSGYSGGFSLSKAFKKRVGVSPREYRRSLRRQ